LIEQMTVGGREQAIVTDFDEMVGQDVLEETTDKLFGRDGREFDLLGGRILVRESDLTILELENAAIADGDAKDVRGQIFAGGFSRADGLTMNHGSLCSRFVDRRGETGRSS
jgi:hypothetical protein